MIVSARRGISHPSLDRSDRPDVPAHIQNLINALEVDVVFVQGTNAARLGAAHMAGVVWRETDTGLFFWDTGVVWLGLGVQTLDGLFANRPAANTLPSGARYYATDTGGTWRTDGAAWTLVDQYPREVTPAQFLAAPYTAPYDGMEALVVVDATTGVMWRVRYRAASAHASKWETVGGEPLESNVATSESATSATYVDLTTAGPSVVVPLNGEYDIYEGALLLGTSAPTAGVAAVKLGAASTADAEKIIAASGAFQNSVFRALKRTLVAGDTVKMQYKNSGGANNVTAEHRNLRVMPRRVG